MKTEKTQGEVCPGADQKLSGHRKNRTPDAERKWRKRHGLPPERRQGQRGPGKGVRPEHQEACRQVAQALVQYPTAHRQCQCTSYETP